MPDPRSLAEWRCSGRAVDASLEQSASDPAVGAASLSPSNSDPGLTALELRALEASTPAPASRRRRRRSAAEVPR